jgi:hypothetical protein
MTMNRAFRYLTFFALALSGACIGAEPKAPAADEPVAETTKALSQTVWHGSQNGGSATAEAYSELSDTYIDAFESKSGKSRSVSMFLFSYTYDPTSQTCDEETICWDPSDPNSCETYEYCYYARYTYTNGYGQLPKKDFSVGKKTAELHTDLAKDPNFYASTCDQDGNCAAATGTIDVSWAANGQYSSQTNGTSSYTYSFGNEKYSARTSGVSSSSSANVLGTALGHSMDSSYGSVYASSGSSITKDIIKN